MGLEVWLDPWGVGQAFGGETYSNLIAKDLQIRQVDSQGNSLPIACLNQEIFRGYLLKWIDAAKSLKADTLFWDEPHFMIYPEDPGNTAQKLWACCCQACQEKFKKSKGSAMPKLLTPEVRLFKEDSIVEFTRFLCDATAKAGMKPAVCLLPFESSSTVNDWGKVATIPSLQVIGTDPYWQPHEPHAGTHVARFAKRIAELSTQHKKEGQIWILNFNIPKGEEGKIKEAIEAAYKEGIRNFAAWSYFGAAYIKLAAQDPKSVWTTLSSCYKELSKISKS